LRFEQLIDLERYRLFELCRGYFGCLAGQALAVVIHLMSVKHNWRLRLRVFALMTMLTLWSSRSMTMWNGANWFEREAFDLFGILFAGHPDLRRILTDYGFVGHPFRKDFPVSGHVEMRFTTQSRGVWFISRLPSSRARSRRASCARKPTGTPSRTTMAEIRNYTHQLWPAASMLLTACCVWCWSWMVRWSSVLIRISACCIVQQKSWLKQKTWVQSVPYMDRLDYVSMMLMSMRIAWRLKSCWAGSAAAAQYIRVMIDEITRILNHLLNVGTHALDIGAMTYGAVHLPRA
jgi:NADH:ubiquinone oxidoreductase subunit C